MRYLIYGAGGVGGVIGARLFQHGHEVVLIGRGEHLAAIQREGLRLQTPEGTEQLRLAAVGHPSELTFRDDDVVLLTVKTQDSVAALDDLRRAGGDALPVICAQTGWRTSGWRRAASGGSMGCRCGCRQRCWSRGWC